MPKHQTDINEPLSLKTDLDKAAPHQLMSNECEAMWESAHWNCYCHKLDQVCLSSLFCFKFPAQALPCSENVAACLCLRYDLYAAEACNESISSISSGKKPVHVLILLHKSKPSQRGQTQRFPSEAFL